MMEVQVDGLTLSVSLSLVRCRIEQYTVTSVIGTNSIYALVSQIWLTCGSRIIAKQLICDMHKETETWRVFVAICNWQFWLKFYVGWKMPESVLSCHACLRKNGCNFYEQLLKEAIVIKKMTSFFRPALGKIGLFFPTFIGLALGSFRTPAGKGGTRPRGYVGEGNFHRGGVLAPSGMLVVSIRGVVAKFNIT